MRGISGSRGFDYFAGRAPAFSQNMHGKVSVILETTRELTAGDTQERKLFEISEKFYQKLKEGHYAD